MSSYKDELQWYKNIFEQLETTIGFNEYLSTSCVNINLIFHIDKDIYNDINKKMILDMIDTIKIVLNKYGINCHIINIRDVDFDKSSVNTLLDISHEYQSQLTSNPLDNKDLHAALILLTTHKRSQSATGGSDPAGIHYNYGNMKAFIAVNLYKDQYYMPWEIKQNEYFYSKLQVILHEIGHYLGAGHDQNKYNNKPSIMNPVAFHVKHIDGLFYSSKTLDEFKYKTSVEDYYSYYTYQLSINDSKILTVSKGDVREYNFTVDTPNGTLKDIIVYFHPYGDTGSLINYLNKINEPYEHGYNYLKFTHKQKDSQLQGWYAYIGEINIGDKIVYTNPVIIILE